MRRFKKIFLSDGLKMQSDALAYRSSGHGIEVARLGSYALSRVIACMIFVAAMLHIASDSEAWSGMEVFCQDMSIIYLFRIFLV